LYTHGADAGVNAITNYDTNRSLQPESYDMLLKRRAKGRDDKIPLTIGMLYQAIKMQRWDTQKLEGI
jgi:hypothetical protein